MPTGVDVRKLIDTFGQLAEGFEITHEEIEAVIGVPRTSNRYRTVTYAWRNKLLRDHNRLLESVPGIGYRSLGPGERISSAVKGVQQGARKQLRAIRLSERVVTDDPVLTKKQELLRRYGAAIHAEANNMLKQIEPPKSAQQSPRLVRAAS